MRTYGARLDPDLLHPWCRHWEIRPGWLRGDESDAVALDNLRVYGASKRRYEHNLEPIAQVGEEVLEIATASEPLYLGHINLTDEFNILMTTGDRLMDNTLVRTFFFRPYSEELVAYSFGAPGSVVLHPVDFCHWPGKLKDPFAPQETTMERRRLLTLVYCGRCPDPSPESRLTEKTLMAQGAALGLRDDFPGLSVSVGHTKVYSADPKHFFTSSFLTKALLPDTPEGRWFRIARVRNSVVEMAALRSPLSLQLAAGSYLIVFEGDLDASLRQKSLCVEGRLGPGDMLRVGADAALSLSPSSKAAVLLRFCAVGDA